MFENVLLIESNIFSHCTLLAFRNVTSLVSIEREGERQRDREIDQWKAI